MAELFTPITEQNTGMHGAYQKGNTCAVHAMLNAQNMSNIEDIVSEMELSKDDLLMTDDFFASETFQAKFEDFKQYSEFVCEPAIHGVFDELIDKFYPEVMKNGMNMWQLQKICRDERLRVFFDRKNEELQKKRIEKFNEMSSELIEDAEGNLVFVFEDAEGNLLPEDAEGNPEGNLVFVFKDAEGNPLPEDAEGNPVMADTIEMAEWFGKVKPKIAQLTKENEQRLIEYLTHNHPPNHGLILCMETGTKLKHFVAVFSIEKDGFLVIDSNFGFALKFVPFSRIHEIVIL